jgi:hypothetical protein
MQPPILFILLLVTGMAAAYGLLVEGREQITFLLVFINQPMAE